MIRLLFLIGLAVLGFFFFRWLYHQPRSVQWRGILGLVVAVLLLLVVTGRAHWLAAAFAVLLALLRLLLPLLGQLPLLKRVFGGGRNARSSTSPDQGQTSTVQSAYIIMTLNHDSGGINGEVLAGKFKGQMLDQLSLADLLELLQECRDDAESAALLESFLDRKYEHSWREHASRNEERQTADEPESGSNEMSRDEALQILGLSPGASEEAVVEAHRRLMQTLHPDRGGSTYLAARINRAKEVLLAK